MRALQPFASAVERTDDIVTLVASAQALCELDGDDESALSDVSMHALAQRAWDLLAGDDNNTARQRLISEAKRHWMACDASHRRVTHTPHRHTSTALAGAQTQLSVVLVLQQGRLAAAVAECSAALDRVLNPSPALKVHVQLAGTSRVRMVPFVLGQQSLTTPDPVPVTQAATTQPSVVADVAQVPDAVQVQMDYERRVQAAKQARLGGRQHTARHVTVHDVISRSLNDMICLCINRMIDFMSHAMQRP